jgi:hypothetical protein
MAQQPTNKPTPPATTESRVPRVLRRRRDNPQEIPARHRATVESFLKSLRSPPKPGNP